jgi:hypothetical protein
MDPAEFEKKMALYHESLRYCTQCHAPLMSNEKTYMPTICRACAEKNKAKLRFDKINALRAGLTLEERIAKCEEMLFDHFDRHPQKDWAMR